MKVAHTRGDEEDVTELSASKCFAADDVCVPACDIGGGCVSERVGASKVTCYMPKGGKV